MIPNANMDALLNAPPEKESIKPNNPLELPPVLMLVASIPGNTIWLPIR